MFRQLAELSLDVADPDSFVRGGPTQPRVGFSFVNEGGSKHLPQPLWIRA